MSSVETEVSWSTLRKLIRGWAGGDADLAEVRHLHGGSISNTLGLLLNNGERAVLKVSPHRVDRSLAREAQQLAHLRLLGVPVPTVLSWKLADLDEPHSYLLMEHCEGVTLSEAKKQCSPEEFDRLQEDLARVVLKMHEHVGSAYLRVGEYGELGRDYGCWSEFFGKVYEPLWKELEANPQTSKTCKRNFLKVHEALPRLLIHQDVPRLTHWDLWASNVLASMSEGVWKVKAILDPICKYAHFEAELAYLEMFGTINPAFLRVYKEQIKPSGAYQGFRKAVYQLYYWMDHAAFFGGKYHAKLEEESQRVAAMI